MSASSLHAFHLSDIKWHLCHADFSSLLPNGNKVTMVTHFETPEPSAVYFTKMTQDPKTGKLTVLSTEYDSDFSTLIPHVCV
jgi:hypothetical protein